MTPKQVKDLAKSCSCMVCKEIVLQDLYLNIPKPVPTQQGREIVSRWGDRPCKGGCGKIIKPGTKVWWEPNWGISHLECH